MMLAMWHTFRQLVIIAFCFWHMGAVALYALPPNVQNPVVTKLNETLRPSVRPYMLTTSQWQRWNLFSPDPLRRMITFTVYADSGAGMQPQKIVNTTTIPWHRRSAELKILRRLEEEGASKQLKDRYAELFCKELHLPVTTPLQLRKSIAIIPKHSAPQSIGWWKAWQPEWSKEEVMLTILCPSSL